MNKLFIFLVFLCITNMVSYPEEIINAHDFDQQLLYINYGIFSGYSIHAKDYEFTANYFGISKELKNIFTKDNVAKKYYNNYANNMIVNKILTLTVYTGLATSLTMLLIDIKNQSITEPPYYPGLIFLGSVLLTMPAIIFEGIAIENLFKAVNVHNQNLFLNNPSHN